MTVIEKKGKSPRAILYLSYLSKSCCRGASRYVDIDNDVKCVGIEAPWVSQREIWPRPLDSNDLAMFASDMAVTVCKKICQIQHPRIPEGQKLTEGSRKSEGREDRETQFNCILPTLIGFTNDIG